MSYRIGIDIGGTFTDFVLVDDTNGAIYTDKRLTTHNDLSQAFFEGFDVLVRNYVVDIKRLQSVLHGTTVATNMVMERSGGRIGLITTKGFKDILDLRKGLRYDQYDLGITYPDPVVQRSLRFEVNERTAANGRVLVELNDSEVFDAASELIETQGVSALAVCLLNSFVNPKHEQRIKNLIAKKYPMMHISLSSDIAPHIREYERMSTTVVNAYIQPRVQEYLRRTEEGLRSRGYGGDLFIMTCSGGAITSPIAREQPILLLESGPAGGVISAQFFSKSVGHQNTLGFDMGGTTAKGCVIKDGVIPKAYEMEVARNHRFKRGSGLPLVVPNIKLIEIGGGGSSIASLDSLGLIKVGPLSAGSNPGPACYGLGGDKPTLTDADLVLGYLDAKYFLGGNMVLNPELGRDAIERSISKPLGISVEEAAWGIHEKVNEDVSQAFRLHAAERGVDLRGYSLVCSGGSAPIHAARIAKKLNMGVLVSPLRAGVLSALGLLMTHLSLDYSESYRSKLSDLTKERYVKVFEAMIRKGSDPLAHMGVKKSELKIERLLDMRYEGQGYDIEVRLPDREEYGEFNELFEIYERAYEHLYMLRGISSSVEISSFKVSVMGPDPQVRLAASQDATMSRTSALKGKRKVFFESLHSFIECLVYDRYCLKPGDAINGPAIIEEKESTCVLQPETKATVDKFLSIIQEL
jgi:N-methylhydantoinase A